MSTLLNLISILSAMSQAMQAMSTFGSRRECLDLEVGKTYRLEYPKTPGLTNLERIELGLMPTTFEASFTLERREIDDDTGNMKLVGILTTTNNCDCAKCTSVPLEQRVKSESHEFYGSRDFTPPIRFHPV